MDKINNTQSLLKFDVMLDDRFVATLRMPYCPIFAVDEDEVRAFVLKKLPTLKNKKFRVEFYNKE